MNKLPRPVYPQPSDPKRRCTVTVTEQGWLGARSAAIAAGCDSISEMLEKIGRGELSVVSSDQIETPLTDEEGFYSSSSEVLRESNQPLSPAVRGFLGALPMRFLRPVRRLYHLAITAACAALILIPLLYAVEMTLPGEAVISDAPAEIPQTGDQVAGYDITDHFRIRPVHPVTGAKNVPHNGVDVATPTGTPIYAVGGVGDQVTVKCWWDVDGGGWVADQTADSFPDYVFQSLHLQADSCRAGRFQSGEVIARTGQSGLGTGEHYDFRVKLKGRYIPPEKPFLEAALTGNALPNKAKRFLFWGS